MTTEITRSRGRLLHWFYKLGADLRRVLLSHRPNYRDEHQKESEKWADSVMESEVHDDIIDALSDYSMQKYSMTMDSFQSLESKLTTMFTIPSGLLIAVFVGATSNRFQFLPFVPATIAFVLAMLSAIRGKETVNRATPKSPRHILKSQTDPEKVRLQVLLSTQLADDGVNKVVEWKADCVDVSQRLIFLGVCVFALTFATIELTEKRHSIDSSADKSTTASQITPSKNTKSNPVKGLAPAAMNQPNPNPSAGATHQAPVPINKPSPPTNP